MPEPGWYAIRTKVNREESVERSVLAKGYRVWLPKYFPPNTYRTPKALFPGYVFFELPGGPGRIVTTPGVLGIASIGCSWARIDDAEIESVRIIETSPVGRTPSLFLPEGLRVRVKSGPLAGVEGTLGNGDGKLVVSISLLRRDSRRPRSATW